MEGPRSHSWGVTELGFELMLPWLSRCHTWHLIWVLDAGLSPGGDGGSWREVGAWAGPGPWTKSDGNNGSSGGWVAMGRVGAGARGCGERWWADPGDSAPPVPSSSFWVRMGVTLGISAPTPRQTQGSNRRQNTRGREGTCNGMAGDHTLVLTEH